MTDAELDEQERIIDDYCQKLWRVCVEVTNFHRSEHKCMSCGQTFWPVVVDGCHCKRGWWKCPHGCNEHLRNISRPQYTPEDRKLLKNNPIPEMIRVWVTQETVESEPVTVCVTQETVESEPVTVCVTQETVERAASASTAATYARRSR